MPNQIEALAAERRRPALDVLSWPVVARHIKRGRGDLFDLMAKISGNGQRLEEHLGHDHSTADIKHNTALELSTNGCEHLKIPITGLAEHCTAGGGVLMNDVRTNRDMNRHRDVQLGSGRQDGQGLIWITCGPGRFTQGATSAKASLEPLRQCGIHTPTGLISHAEAPVIQPTLHIFTGFTLITELEIVNSSSAMKSDRIDETAPHCINKNGIQPNLDRMRAHHQQNRLPTANRRNDRRDDSSQVLNGEEIGQTFQELGKLRTG